MRRIAVVFLVIAFSGFCFSGLCFAKEAKDIHVAVVIKDLVNPGFVEMKWGGYAAAKKYGVNYSCLAPEKYTVDGQIRIMEDLIQKKVDAIVIIPIDGKGIVSGIERANDAGIPVFNCNTKAAGGEVIGFCGVDHVILGNVLGEYLVKALNGKGKVVILEGTTGASTARERLQGTMEGLKKAAGIEVLASTTARYNRQIAMKVMEDYLVRYPKIDAVAAMADMMAFGALEAIKDSRRMKEMIVGGINADPEALDSIKNGELAVSVDSNDFGQGYKSVELTIRYLLYGEKPDKETRIGTAFGGAVTANNVEKYRILKKKRYTDNGLEYPF